MFNRFYAVFNIFIICLVWDLLAVPANPFPQEVRQADGSVVVIAGRGDEFFNWVEDENGYVVAFNGDTENWSYAYISPDRQIVPSFTAMGTATRGSAVPFRKITADDIFPLIQEGVQRNPRHISNISASPAALSNMNPALLVILVEFADIQIANTMQFWQGHFFGNQKGQLNDYFSEVSNGQFQWRGMAFNGGNRVITAGLPSGVSRIEFFENVAKVRLSKNHPRFSSTNTGNIRPDVETAFGAIRNHVSFAEIPQQNGWVRNSDLSIYAVIAGWEASNSSNDNQQQRIWAHASNITSSTIGNAAGTRLTGILMLSYATQGEIYEGTLNNPAVMGIGIAAHELGHSLGLPDLYDITNASWGIGPFCLMASGSWGGTPAGVPGHIPTHLSAWAKYALGFVNPIAVPADRHWKGNLHSIAQGGYNVLKLTSTANPRQYFLLENRGITGYDAGFERYGMTIANNNNGGILIYHIDETMTDNQGRISNENKNRRGVDIEAADGSNILGNSPRSSADFRWFNHFFSNSPYQRVAGGGTPPSNYGGRNGTFNAFNPMTTPNSNFYEATGTRQSVLSNIEVKINSERSAIMEVEAGASGETSLTDVKKSDKRHGIIFAANIVSERAEIMIFAEGGRIISAPTIRIYDMTGNLVWASTGSATGGAIVWDLRNSAGRLVANGTYLVIAEVKGAGGKIYHYSAKLGVKR